MRTYRAARRPIEPSSICCVFPSALAHGFQIVKNAGCYRALDRTIPDRATLGGRLAPPDMLCEYADNANWSGFGGIEEGGRKAFSRFAKPQELVAAFGRRRTSLAGQFVQRDAADRAQDRLRNIQHRELENHAIVVVADDLIPHKRHAVPTVPMNLRCSV
jgi:hypothetical protein